MAIRKREVRAAEHARAADSLVGFATSLAADARSVGRLEMNLRNWPGLLVAGVALAWPILVVSYFWWRLTRLMGQGGQLPSAARS